ncbi:glutathione S-transferase family protein [Massilia cavernae]|uniref:Glutathione S-transferase family protein n=1 Tax=Massilia cavernae TaxID=2320864 RepID=A0A418XPU6_9BURK|nr:glutathione S-transferase [Massilia cavernae]RJG14474.1 glutathione S-transferase family protein [Massilia cavernae]
MLKLCGFAASNYYNKVKLALMEKDVPFEEVLVWTTKPTEEMLARSPLGKVPFLETEDGPLAESQVLVNYIEARFPEVPLLPRDVYQAAKVQELITFMELHLELVARELYGAAFFGGTISDSSKERVRKQLAKNVPAFARLAKFAPYIAGDSFTMADCAAVCHLPLISSATKKILGEDVLAGLPSRDYLKFLGERATVQKVNADRKASLESFTSALAK